MKSSKIIVAILIFTMMFMNVTAFAGSVGSKVQDAGSIFSQKTSDTATKAGSIEGVLGGNAGYVAVGDGTASNILGAMQWIGYAIAVGMLIYIGIKYTMSAADERANLKGSLVKYVIGAVLIASAVTVVGIVFNIGNYNKVGSNSNVSSVINAGKP